MSLGTLGRATKHSRSAMLELEAEETAAEFVRRFHIRDGDYIAYWRKTAHGHVKTQARVVSVDHVYQNQAGGFTARVAVMPLLSSGRIGNTARIELIATAGGSLSTWRGGDVQRLSPKRKFLQ